MAARPIDPELLAQTAKRVFGHLTGAVTSGLIYLGDALGLYRALADGGPASSTELAERSGLDERWVREWLYNQASAGLVESEEGRFSLTPEAEAVLAREEHPAFGAGQFQNLPVTMSVLPKLRESFRTGVGLPYDAFGPEGAQGVERGFAPWLKNFFVPVGVPAVEGLPERLAAGARVADVGCGGGIALLELAKAFPACELHGFELSRHALERAEANRDAAGCSNLHFHHVSETGLADHGPYELILTFDCLHDMTRPDHTMAEIRRAIADDGVWMIADIRSYPSFEENRERNPMAALMYGFSVLTCMSSATSEPDGLGLGTLGFHAQRAEEMARAAGFRSFAVLDIDNPVNAFYEVRP